MKLLLILLLWGEFASGFTTDTCFSPEGYCDSKLNSFLSQAKSSLDIAIYAIDLDLVTQTIIRASKTLKVRMVVDRVQAAGKKSTVPELKKAGVQIKYGVQKGSGIMHDKFSIVDGKALETGSFNYTGHATSFNHENQFYFSDPEIVARYSTVFESLWSGGAEIK